MDETQPLEAVPKAELHVHLEGSLERAVLDRIGARKGLPPPAEDFYVFRGFEGFNQVFRSLARYLETGEDFEDAAFAFAERQAGDRIVYTEAFVMPLFHTSRGVDPEVLFQGLESGLRRGEEEHGVQIRLLFSVPRILGPEAGFRTLELLERRPWERVLGIDLAGTERENDPAPFAPVFERARAMGLHTVAHAGEFTTAEHVRRTLDLLGPERIGHGIRAVDDPALTARLAGEGIPLEVCPSSNQCLGAAPLPWARTTPCAVFSARASLC
jgi:adenosine deaminase